MGRTSLRRTFDVGSTRPTVRFREFFREHRCSNVLTDKGIDQKETQGTILGWPLSLSVNFEITRSVTASVVNPVMIGFLKRYRKRLSKQQWYPKRKVFPFEGGLAESGRIECYSRELARSHGVADAIHVSREND